MARIAIGGLHHETNSFAPQPATFERFVEADAWPPLCRGGELIERTRGANLAITGFIEAAASGHQLVPLTWANACPSGPVTRDAFERLAAMLIGDLETSMPVDGLFLDLHGAMVTEHLEDGEGELLERIRRRFPGLPVVCALDLHANVSERMVANSDVLCAYRTYPHVDLAETGARCLIPLERRLAGRHFVSRHRKGDYLIPLPWQCTEIEPARGLYRLMGDLERRYEVVPSLCLGFPAADTSACGPSVIVCGTVAERAERVAGELAAALAEAEPQFAGKLWAPEEAVARARANRSGGPVILADTQDNPGGGGSSDTTGILAELIRQQAEKAALALMVDPAAAEAAHAAGTGAILRNFPLGGRHGPAGVEPLSGDYRIERLGDGRFVATGPMYRGNRVDLGAMALLVPEAAPGVRVLVSSRRLQAADQAIFRHLGIEPASQRILVLKSSVHFRADFAPIASEILIVEAPGHVIVDPCRLPFTRLPRERRCRPLSHSPV